MSATSRKKMPISSTPQYVTHAQHHQQLETLQAQVYDPLAGLFGPGSMSWEVNKYSTVVLGAGRAALLQLAHPWVATAIDQHSRVKEDPLGRLRRTATRVLTMVYGSQDQAFQAANSVYKIHEHITGELSTETGVFSEGSAYCANEVNAMFWVHSTLLESSVKMYELFVRPLSEEEKNRYFEESKRFASLFGIPEAAFPSSWPEFMEYNEGMWESDVLTVGKEGRNIAAHLINLEPHPLLRKFWRDYQIITSLMMPPRLRGAFDLPADTVDNRRVYEKNIQRIKKIVPFLPRHLRYLPPYLEAHRRIHGKKHPDFVTAFLNKLIFKQARLVS